MTIGATRIFDLHNVEQHSDAWHTLRLGRLTSSRAADAFATIKSGEAAAVRNLRTQLVLERLCGQSMEDDYQSRDMQRGIELEAEARAAYEAATSQIVGTCGFLTHPTLMAGASPDGQIDDYTGLVELKCPKAATHLGYLKSKTIPNEYLCQVRHQLWLTGAEWCDWVSYAPQFPEALRLQGVRVWMSETERAAWEVGVRAFLESVEKELSAMKRMAETV